MLPLEIFPPLWGGGDLHATHRVEARMPVELQLRVPPDGVLRELGHRLGGIGLEHEARGVGGGSARLEQRSLIEDHQVPPAHPRQVLGYAAPDDAGPDDHNSRPMSHR